MGKQPSVRRTRIEGRLRTEAELAEFIWRAFRVRIPNERVCERHSTPWEAFCDAYYARSPVSVWKASRGLGGKTYMLALLAVVEGLTLKADVNLLGGSGGQSSLGLRYVGQFLGKSNIVQGGAVSEVTHETTLSNGARVRALMASQTSVRGPHPVRLRLDEVDEMKRAIFDAALGQPMSKDGVSSHVLASSTHQYPNGTMTEVLKQATARGWHVHEWCYRESAAGEYGWLSEDEIDRKRAMVPVAMWDVEFELQEPSTEGRAIVPEKVSRMFRAEMGEFSGLAGDKPIELEGPVKGGKYAHGADWARKVDFTDIGTLRFDVKPMRLIAFERQQRKPWPQMAARFDDRIKRFGGAACHDGTGLGDVVADLLMCPAEAVIMVGRERKDILAEYVAAVERDEIDAPLIKSVEAEHRYCTVEDLYGDGHPPDSIVMGALAYRASKKRQPAQDIVIPMGLTQRSGWRPAGYDSGRESEAE